MAPGIIVHVMVAHALCRGDGTPEVRHMQLAEGSSIFDLIACWDILWPGLASQVLSGGGQVADHVNLYLNGDNVRYGAGVATMLRQGDVVNIIPAAAAG